MITKYESIYKFDYELYNRLCPGIGEPDSDIIEYAQDVLYMINLLIDNK